jgi:predicted outer membrane repeat protein
MKRALMTAICASAVLLSGCIEFRSIDQPTSALPNDLAAVDIEVFVQGTDSLWYSPCFGICLPTGWTVSGDSIRCEGDYMETITFDSLYSSQQEDVSPAPDGYYWWVGIGPSAYIDSGYVSATVEIQTNDQTGLFIIDYMLGESYNGVNRERSDNHLIGIVDEYTPRGLAANLEASSTTLTWEPPLIVDGLMGYNLYRNQQMLNSELLSDSTFTDIDTDDGILRYAVSSIYSDSSEHLTQYELPVIYGDCYISPGGNNENTGSSFLDALQTITFALSINSLIPPDSLHPHIVYLAPGTYSPDTNGEDFPVRFSDYLSIVGSGEGITILDADSTATVLEFSDVESTSIEGLMVTNGSKSGIFCNNSDPRIESVIICENYSDHEGGGLSCYESSPILRGVTINNNVAEVMGGGISCRYWSNPILENVVLTGNQAHDYGGGIYCHTSYPTLTNVIMRDNRTNVDGGNTFGGGLFCYNSDPYLQNAVFSRNVSILGGGIYCGYSGDPILCNCILWDDTPEEIYLYGSVSVTYSCIQDGWYGDGNIEMDPLFRDAENGDFHLMSTDCDDPDDSPCIDAGHPDILDSLLDCFWGLGELRSDMGAYGGGDSVQVGVDDGQTRIPGEFAIYQNYPNPFNTTTTIRYSLPAASDVTLDIYDVLGRKVARLVEERQPAGYHRALWQASDVNSGVYFYKIKAGGRSETGRMILIK